MKKGKRSRKVKPKVIIYTYMNLEDWKRSVEEEYEAFVSSSRKKDREKEKQNRHRKVGMEYTRGSVDGDLVETTGKITDEVQVCIKALVFPHNLSISYQSFT